ncbi:hypothetical protein [Phocaeicola sp.]
MKNWLLHIIYIGVLGMLIVSCNQDDMVQQPSDGTINVTFTLAMNASHSRALPDFTEEQGNIYENMIDAGGLQVLFYSSDLSTCMGKVENISIFKTGENYIYTFVGDLKLDKANFKENTNTISSCKVMVFANCPEVTTNTNLSDGLVYSFDNGTSFLNGNTNIPMWGVASFYDLTLAPGVYTNLGTIYILRALAKVEVIMSDAAATEFNLNSVLLKNNYNTTGRCLPKSFADASVTTDMDTDAKLFNAASSTATGTLAFKQGETNHWILYLPEYDNSTNPSYIATDITTKAGEPVGLKDPNIYFKVYNDGIATSESFNITRNYHYRYIIDKVNTGSELSLICNAQPWTINEESWDYSDNVSIQSEGLMKWNENTIDGTPTTDAQVKMKYNTVAECTFKIDTPSEATWYASLIPVEGDFDAFQFADGVSSGEVGKPATLKIKVTNNEVTHNNKAKLQIVARTKDGRTIHVQNLLGTGYAPETQYTLVQTY